MMSLLTNGLIDFSPTAFVFLLLDLRFCAKLKVCASCGLPLFLAKADIRVDWSAFPLIMLLIRLMLGSELACTPLSSLELPSVVLFLSSKGKIEFISIVTNIYMLA